MVIKMNHEPFIAHTRPLPNVISINFCASIGLPKLFPGTWRMYRNAVGSATTKRLFCKTYLGEIWIIFNRVITHPKAPMLSPDVAIFTRPFEFAIPNFLLIANVKFVSCATGEFRLSGKDSCYIHHIQTRMNLALEAFS